jgi:hypothetical protein
MAEFEDCKEEVSNFGSIQPNQHMRERWRVRGSSLSAIPYPVVRDFCSLVFSLFGVSGVLLQIAKGIWGRWQGEFGDKERRVAWCAVPWHWG